MALFWSENGSGLGDAGGTPPQKIPRITPDCTTAYQAQQEQPFLIEKWLHVSMLQRTISKRSCFANFYSSPHFYSSSFLQVFSVGYFFLDVVFVCLSVCLYLFVIIVFLSAHLLERTF